MTLFRKLCILLLAVVLLLTASCAKRSEPPEETVDPHKGMVEVADGAGGTMWVPLADRVEVNNLPPQDFSVSEGRVLYSGDEYKAQQGIDVSFYQGEIDWEAVRSEGIEFAMIRAGYRGYSEGELFEDEKFREYVEGASDAGLDIGVYFFSQATSIREAREEAEFTLSIIADYDITLPVAFDWETIGFEEARTDNVDGETVTDCAVTFCSVIRGAGYEPGVYMYRRLGYYAYDLARFAGIVLWVGAAGDYPDFYYKHEIWQYSFTGRVRGIKSDVDLNLRFIPNGETADEEGS